MKRTLIYAICLGLCATTIATTQIAHAGPARQAKNIEEAASNFSTALKGYLGTRAMVIKDSKGVFDGFQNSTLAGSHKKLLSAAEDRVLQVDFRLTQATSKTERDSLEQALKVYKAEADVIRKSYVEHTAKSRAYSFVPITKDGVVDVNRALAGASKVKYGISDADQTTWESPN